MSIEFEELRMIVSWRSCIFQICVICVLLLQTEVNCCECSGLAEVTQYSEKYLLHFVNAQHVA